MRQRPAPPSEQTKDSLDGSSVKHIAIPSYHAVRLEKRIERCFLGRLGDRFENHIEQHGISTLSASEAESA